MVIISVILLRKIAHPMRGFLDPVRAHYTPTDFGSAMSVEICSGQQEKNKNRRKKRDYHWTLDNELALMSSSRTLEKRTESHTQRGRGASCSPSQAGSKTSTWRHKVNLDS